MKYHIMYQPVFYKKDKTLSGYNMTVMTNFIPEEWEDYDCISVDHDCGGRDEYARLSRMLKACWDTVDDVAFVDKHPLAILRYLRGEKDPVERDDDWEYQIEGWRVNVRGERV